MGSNQNKIQQNIEEQDIINLDEIIEEWIWFKLDKRKSKKLSRLKREDLLIKINWKNVSFIQNNIHFYNSLSSSFSRTIFRTNFSNKTMNEQIFNFITQRSTYSIFKYIFTHSLYKSQESTINFCLPEQIIQLNNGIQSEQYIQFGLDTTKEYEIPWNVNSQIHVPSRTRIIAELNIDEEEFHSHFSVPIRFSGRIQASIATRQLPNTYLKFIDDDIVKIICQVMKNDHRLKNFEILGGNFPSVCFTMYGKCSFRYGIKQNIVLNQESLETSNSSCSELNFIPSAPEEYCHLTSSDMNNNDLIHSDIKHNEQL